MRPIIPILATIGVGLLIFSVFYEPTCTPPSYHEAERGSHGFRIWSGATLQSFKHAGGRICVAEGWEPIGHLRSGPGWATFPAGATGVLIRSDAFASSEVIRVPSYEVTLRYPKKLEDVSKYERIVRNAFERTDALFPDSKTQAHTVLVTTGLPLTDDEDASIYPDPNEQVSYFILKPNYHRAEELMIHAVMHLYNRYGADAPRLSRDALISPEDFTEYEASWAELAFATNTAGRDARTLHLHTLHEGIVTRDIEKTRGSFFYDASVFEMLNRSGTTSSESSYFDAQYAHYVLAPLIMVGIDTLLERQTETTVEELLHRVHEDTSLNFFDEVFKLLPNEEDRIRGWIAGTGVVPRDLVIR